MPRALLNILLAAIAALLCTSCYYSHPNRVDHWAVAGEEAVDSVNFYITHHYWTGYNFQTTDSLTLQTAAPAADFAEGYDRPADSIVVRRGEPLVVARVMYVPTDSTDSVWVKVAADQLSQGWIHESALLERVVPDDSISKFIHSFSSGRTQVAATLLGLALLFVIVQRMRHKNVHMVHLRDIPSFYPTLLCLCVSGSAVIYGSMQRFVPSTWVEFYFHPTLNPFNSTLPPILSIFIASVWAILIAAVAVVDETRRQRDLGDNLSYLASLGGVCMILYLVFTLTTPYYIGYALLIAYWTYAIRQYVRHKPSHLVCGMCGRSIQGPGMCPHCGSINE